MNSAYREERTDRLRVRVEVETDGDAEALAAKLIGGVTHPTWEAFNENGAQGIRLVGAVVPKMKPCGER